MVLCQDGESASLELQGQHGEREQKPASLTEGGLLLISARGRSRIQALVPKQSVAPWGRLFVPIKKEFSDEGEVWV